MLTEYVQNSIKYFQYLEATGKAIRHPHDDPIETHGLDVRRPFINEGACYKEVVDPVSGMRTREYFVVLSCSLCGCPFCYRRSRNTAVAPMTGLSVEKAFRFTIQRIKDQLVKVSQKYGVSCRIDHKYACQLRAEIIQGGGINSIDACNNAFALMNRAEIDHLFS
jgi:hypothetical protein